MERILHEVINSEKSYELQYLVQFSRMGKKTTENTKHWFHVPDSNQNLTVWYPSTLWKASLRKLVEGGDLQNKNQILRVLSKKRIASTRLPFILNL